ncbi:hypothetical protein BKA69DRAFT_1052073 [Paraphysoderma sedebokerense]|nr:hypothetical protein BKA69DRAFT_1052073 [Paraphysoderma sedebokerense]
MTTSILSMTNCEWVTCPAEHEFPLRSVQLDVTSIASDFQRNISNGTVCSSCSFNPSWCPIASELCPETQDLRLVKNNSFSCTREIYPYYLPGAVLMFITITVGVPLIFYKLISVSTRYVTEIPAEGDTPTEKWRSQCLSSSNSCRSLYSMFRYRWRYYKLFAIIHKLALVAIFIYGTNNSFLLVASLAASHSLFAALSIYSSPYVSKAEDFLATSCLLVNAANAIIALLIAMNYKLSSEIAYAVAILNIAAPILAVCVGFYAEYRDYQKMQERKRQKMEDLEEKISAQASANQLSINERSSAIQDGNNELIDSLDQELDARLSKLLVNFFLYMGIAAFLSLCVVAIGIIQLTSNGDLIHGDFPGNVGVNYSGSFIGSRY